MRIKLVKYTPEFLRLSWQWLNDQDIRVLTNTPIFSIDDQKKWYLSLKEKKDYFLWGIQLGKNKIGVCGIKKVTNVDCEYWGFIGEKEYWGQGYGSQILLEIFKIAKDKELHSVWLKVLKNNERAISVYVKMGFQIESSNEGNILMRKEIC